MTGRAGAKTPKPRWPDPAKRAEDVARMRGAGWTFRRIAADLGVSVGTVHRDLTLWTQRQADLMIADVQSAVQSASAAGPQSNAD